MVIEGGESGCHAVSMMLMMQLMGSSIASRHNRPGRSYKLLFNYTSAAVE